MAVERQMQAEPPIVPHMRRLLDAMGGVEVRTELIDERLGPGGDRETWRCPFDKNIGHLTLRVGTRATEDRIVPLARMTLDLSDDARGLFGGGDLRNLEWRRDADGREAVWTSDTTYRWLTPTEQAVGSWFFSNAFNRLAPLAQPTEHPDWFNEFRKTLLSSGTTPPTDVVLPEPQPMTPLTDILDSPASAPVSENPFVNEVVTSLSIPRRQRFDHAGDVTGYDDMWYAYYDTLPHGADINLSMGNSGRYAESFINLALRGHEFNRRLGMPDGVRSLEGRLMINGNAQVILESAEEGVRLNASQEQAVRHLFRCVWDSVLDCPMASDMKTGARLRDVAKQLHAVNRERMRREGNPTH